ncbi:fasciclin domain-containing protein [Algivirga pacifica]|uniref:Fasciclin domain-containing protein n=2 Tax=Algivirga pacifica TaxID=1162670 RepID=A0ABP9DCC9_9BACT
MVLSGFAFVSCDDDDDDDDGMDDTTIASLLEETDDLSILLDAVTRAGLLDDLDNTDNEFTVFAPDNDAFTALLSDLGISSLDDVGPDSLADILTYHVVSGSVLSTDLSDGMTVPTLLEGDSLMIGVSGTSVTVNDANVTEADITADNGVVHIIDAVLLPPPYTLVDALSADTSYSLLVEAVVAADLVDALSSTEDTLTVFAPNNDAFRAALAVLGVTSIDEIPTETLTQILLYHVVEGAVLSTDLEDGAEVPTLLEGQSVTVSITDGTVMINTSTVDNADVVTDNGVIHGINAVLVPEGVITPPATAN